MRSQLFRKYFAASLAAIIVPLILTSAIETWFGYREQSLVLDALLRSEARTASAKIQGFIDEIQSRLGSTVQQPWDADTAEAHYLDALEFLREVPSATSVTLVDDRNLEQVFVSRTELNRIGSGDDQSGSSEVAGARLNHFSVGEMEFSEFTQPRMRIAVAGQRKQSGAAIAEIDLKRIRDVISGVRVGESGYAIILSSGGELMGHPDITKVLMGSRSRDMMKGFRNSFGGSPDEIVSTKDPDGQDVVATMAAPLGATNWRVFVLLPKAEAYGPIYAALWRTGGLLVCGGILAAMLSYMFARRLIGPIRLLEEGAAMIGSGQFDHRIKVASRDELGTLAERFNQMAEGLALSQERSERISRLKRFLAPQVAALVEQTGGEGVLESQRAEVVAVFCDIRGYTSFSAQHEPEVIMDVLGGYYRTLGSVISRYQATLTNFAADGLMVLVNAPFPCADPAVQALRMAQDMQEAVQVLVRGWKDHGYDLGFGVGLSIGWATVGRIGYEDRVEYTAIGSAVNLASRMCSAAADGQILFDQSIAFAIKGAIPVVRLGPRKLKGFDWPVVLFCPGPPAAELPDRSATPALPAPS